MARRTQLILFGIVTALGLAAIFLGGTGDLMTLGATGPVYSILDSHGLAGDDVLVGELYAVVLALRPAWTVVQVVGAAVTLVGGYGVLEGVETGAVGGHLVVRSGGLKPTLRRFSGTCAKTYARGGRTRTGGQGVDLVAGSANCAKAGEGGRSRAWEHAPDGLGGTPWGS